MAYFDIDEQDQAATPEQDQENRRRVLAGIVSAPKALPLQPRPPYATPPFLPGAGTPPIVPGQSGAAPVGPQPQPARPTPQMPNRADFPAKPEVSGWKKYLGLGLAGLSGPRTAEPLAENILHHQRNEAERQYGLATQDWERGQTNEARQAQIRNIDSEIQSRLNPKPDKESSPELQTYDYLLGQGQKPDQALETVKGSGKEDKTPKTPSFEEQNYSEWSENQKKLGKPYDRMTFEQAKSAATQKPDRPEKPQRMLGVTPDNQVIELQPGMKLPPGTKSLGGELSLTAKTEQGEEAGKGATQYANDYLAGKQWTGPGDEALMEKFFEMAKPSSGFRMTQAQIEMLQRSRDFMGSVTAKAKHLLTPEAPWFSDTQRQQIVKTMNNLAKSRQEVKAGAGGKDNDPMGIR